MSFISYTPEGIGNRIGVATPNQTIKNIKDIEGNLTSDNFRNQGLEVRNFKRGVVTPRIGRSKFVNLASTFFVSPVINNKLISTNHVIGPFTDYQEEMLIECSFAFEVQGTVSGFATNVDKYPDLYFHIVHGDKSILNPHDEILATRRRFRSNRQDGNRLVAGTYGAAFVWKKADWVSTSPIYFGVTVRDTTNLNNSNATSFHYTVKILQFTLTGREYFK